MANLNAMITLDLLVSLISLSLLAYFYFKRRLALPLPPGPRKLPLIGNLLNMPKGPEWVTYHRWCKELDSDIIHLDVAGTSILVLDTIEVAMELLEKRSSIYSSRPRMPMLTELSGYDYNFAFLGYGNYWREHRRIFHQSFHPAAVKLFNPRLLKATHTLLRRVIEDPEGDIYEHLRYMAGETIMSITYGLDVLPHDDPYITVAEEGTHPIHEGTVPGRFIVDSIPALKYVPDWMPFAGFKRLARDWQQLAHNMVDVPFEAAMNKIDSGEITPSFVSDSIGRMDESRDLKYQEDVIKNTAGTIYLGGADTTISTIASCILAFLAHPDVLRKAQQELDTVLGHGQLPDFKDEDSLPYVMAVVKEALRWREVAPIGIPHRLDVDDEYNGYRLPAGSIVIANAWAMLHDEAAYPDPFTFNPDRFMKDGRLNPTVKDPAYAAFGFGRRICPGRHMAFSAVWIAIVSIIAMFDITKAVDENGEVIDPAVEYYASLLCRPLPFKCSIKPRSKQMADLILATAHYNY